MTAQNPALFLQAGSHPAEDVRRWLHALGLGRNSIFAAGDLAVSEKSGTPNMSVDVAGGRAMILGTEATYQGAYFVENRGVTNLAIAAADGTNPRKDLVIARVKDAAYSGAVNAWELAVVTGVPAASPAEPAVPASSYVLALVDVPAADTAITNSQITDRRTTTTSSLIAPAEAICTSATRPASPFKGMRIFETDTNRLYVYDGANWKPRSTFSMPRCRAVRTAAQTIATTSVVALQCNAADRYDPLGMHDTVTNNTRITIPTGGDGIYIIGGKVNFSNVANGVRNVDIRVSGTTTIGGDGGRPANGTADGDSVEAMTIYDLVAGDYVELLAYQTSGANVDITGEFYVQWVAPL